MFLRFVQIRIRPEHLPDLHRLYRDRIITTLEGVKGCLFVGLLQSAIRSEDCISMTLWSDRETAEQYEQSGPFRELLKASEPYFAESSDWEIRLSDDLSVTYAAVPQSPIIQSFTIPGAGTASAPPGASSLFIRIVTHQVNNNQREHFRNVYMKEVLPALRELPGCRHAYLIENTTGDDKTLSLTIWESRQAAQRYEQSGAFDRLVEKLQPMLSGVYQWKMQMERETGAQVVTTDDISVDGYIVLASKSMPQNEGGRRSE